MHTESTGQLGPAGANDLLGLEAFAQWGLGPNGQMGQESGNSQFRHAHGGPNIQSFHEANNQMKHSGRTHFGPGPNLQAVPEANTRLVNGGNNQLEHGRSNVYSNWLRAQENKKYSSWYENQEGTKDPNAPNPQSMPVANTQVEHCGMGLMPGPNFQPMPEATVQHPWEGLGIHQLGQHATNPMSQLTPNQIGQLLANGVSLEFANGQVRHESDYSQLPIEDGLGVFGETPSINGQLSNTYSDLANTLATHLGGGNSTQRQAQVYNPNLPSYLQQAVPQPQSSTCGVISKNEGDVEVEHYNTKYFVPIKDKRWPAWAVQSAHKKIRRKSEVSSEDSSEVGSSWAESSSEDSSECSSEVSWRVDEDDQVDQVEDESKDSRENSLGISVNKVEDSGSAFLGQSSSYDWLFPSRW